MHLGVTCSMLNQSFSLGAIVMHLGVTHCYWDNFTTAKPIDYQWHNSNVSWGNYLLLG